MGPLINGALVLTALNGAVKTKFLSTQFWKNLTEIHTCDNHSKFPFKLKKKNIPSDVNSVGLNFIYVKGGGPFNSWLSRKHLEGTNLSQTFQIRWEFKYNANKIISCGGISLIRNFNFYLRCWGDRRTLSISISVLRGREGGGVRQKEGSGEIITIR